MAIELGYDEGGDGRDKLLVSVQVAVTEPAKRFKRQWRAALKEANNLAFFHAKDFNNYTGGVFTKAGLSRERRTQLLKELCGLMHTYLLFGVTTRVKISEYNELTNNDFRSRFGTAYGFAIDMCLMSAYAITEQMGYQPVFNILIEKGHHNSAQVSQILDGLEKMLPEMRASDPERIIHDIAIKNRGLGEKKDQPILQAADMLAYADWQGLSRGDPTIWNAIHGQSVRYRTWRVHGDKALIKLFMTEGGAAIYQATEEKS